MLLSRDVDVTPETNQRLKSNSLETEVCLGLKRLRKSKDKAAGLSTKFRIPSGNTWMRN